MTPWRNRTQDILDKVDKVYKVYKVANSGYNELADDTETITMTTAQYMNVRETARLLGVHEHTVRNWEKRGVIKAIKLPGSGYRRFDRAEVERMHQEMIGAAAPDTVTDEHEKKLAGHTAESGDWI